MSALADFPDIRSVFLGTAVVLAILIGITQLLIPVVDVVSSTIPTETFVGNLLVSVLSLIPNLLSVIGMVLGGWYTAHRSNGGPTAGALAGVVPGSIAGGFIVFWAITENVEASLVNAWDIDPDAQLVPLSILIAAFGVLVFASVVLLAAIGGYISRYVPIMLIWKRIRQ